MLNGFCRTNIDISNEHPRWAFLGGRNDRRQVRRAEGGGTAGKVKKRKEEKKGKFL